LEVLAVANRPLIFYFPYHGVGGVSTLFLRLAEAIKNDCPVYLADFKDGYMAKNIPDGVELININDNPSFPVDSVFVFQSFIPWRFPFLSQVSHDSKILFWGLHPQNFDPQIFNELHRNVIISFIAKGLNTVSLWRRRKLVKVVRYLQNRNAVVFMGRENVAATERYLKFAISFPQFLPVPIPAANLFKKKPGFPKTIDCAWVGRICDFKYRILEHIIYRLSSAAETVGSIRMTIVGDGDYRNYIENTASLCETGNFTVVFKGELTLSAIPAFLVEKVDILFAMGTSALEGARVGVPVFLTDFSYAKIIQNYRFKHFFDNSEYCLGEEITETHYENRSSLEASLLEVIGDYQKYSTLSYEYWIAHFSIEFSRQNLLKYIDETNATFGEMSDFGFFKTDFFGRTLRYLPSLFRKDLPAEVVGFRYDC
jgi:hypothetical protein